MTRKHKPQNAHKKRPIPQNSRPVKTAAAEKAIAAVEGLREKGAGERVAGANAKVNDSARGADAKVPGGRLNADKRPLGIERRVPVMPEDRQSQLKLLIARGKEQGYLTYAQVNDHLPSEIVDPEQIEDIVITIN